MDIDGPATLGERLKQLRERNLRRLKSNSVEKDLLSLELSPIRGDDDSTKESKANQP